MRFAQGKSRPPQEGACRPLRGWWTSLRSQRRRLLDTLSTVACAPGARILLQDFLMAPKTIATLLILLASATTGANLASAQGSGSGGSSSGRGLHGGGGGDFHGRARERLPRTRSSRTKLRWIRDRGRSRPREVRRLLAHLGARSRGIYTPVQQPSLPCESFAFVPIDSAQAFRQVGMRIVEKCFKQRAASGANTR